MVTKSLALALALLALLAFAGPSGATVIIIDDSVDGTTPGNNSPAFTASGTGGTGKTSQKNLFNGEGYLLKGTETWTLDCGTGFTPGTYFVYANWYGSSGTSTSAQYTVTATDGAHVFTFNSNSGGAAQGHAGSLPWPTANGSGYYYLGTYALDHAGTVTFKNNDATQICGDSIQLRSPRDGFLIDAAGPYVTSPDATKWVGGGGLNVYAAAPSGAQPSLGFATTSSGTPAVGTLVYNLGQVMTGTCDVQISWATETDAGAISKYTLDLNGDGSNVTVFTQDDKLFANGTTGTPTAAWSGFRDLGTFNLNANSILTVTQNSGNGKITAADVVVASVPEPATVTLLCFGAAGFILRRRRK